MIIKRIALALLLTGCVSGGEQINAAPVPATNGKPLSQPDEGAFHIDRYEFDSWLASFKKKAVERGVTKQTVDTALANVTPIEKVIQLDKKQPEKKLTKEEYLAKVINDARIEKGRRLLDENRAVLNDISARTGVEPEFIVALWGLESGFGANTGNYSIINSLATLAYEGRRRDFFESELLSALVIIDQGSATADQLKGSWAGAMGQCQFMPSSYLAYAVDYNNDGRINIWGDKHDVFASIANYLSTVGWGADDATKTKALMHWNRSTYFVASVFQLAESIR